MDTGATEWKERGNGYYRQKRYEEALRCYSEAVQTDPLYADAWYNLGMTCRALGYVEEAVTCFERAKHYGQEGGNGTNPARISPKSSVKSQISTRNGPPDTRKNLNSWGLTPGKNRQSLKVRAMVIGLLLVLLVIALAVSIPFITGKGGISLFPFSGSAGTDTRGSAFQQGQVIVKSPSPLYSAVPAVSQGSEGIPKEYTALKTGAVSKSFPYVLRGEQGTLNLTLYEGVSREIAKEDPYSYVGEKDRYMKFIYLPVQEPFLIPLVDAIRGKTNDPDDQVRIAVSLVQQIPYDQEMLDSGTLEIRYPYQTLFDNRGVCCEKSGTPRLYSSPTRVWCGITGL